MPNVPSESFLKKRSLGFRRSRRRRRGSQTVSTRTRRRDAAAAVNVEAGWERIASSMTSYLGRPRIPPECTEFKDSYFHENGYLTGGSRGDHHGEKQKLDDGQVIQEVRQVTSGGTTRTKQPYPVYRRHRERQAEKAQRRRKAEGQAAAERGWRELEVDQANARLRKPPTKRGDKSHGHRSTK